MSMSNAQITIQKALAALRLPATKIANGQPKNLYDLLSRQPSNGVGAIVRPIKYADRNYPKASFYKVVYSNIDPANPTKGEVYAYKYYNGHLVDQSSHALPKLVPNGYRDKWELVHHAQPATSPYSFVKQARRAVARRASASAPTPTASPSSSA